MFFSSCLLFIFNQPYESFFSKKKLCFHFGHCLLFNSIYLVDKNCSYFWAFCQQKEECNRSLVFRNLLWLYFTKWRKNDQWHLFRILIIYLHFEGFFSLDKVSIETVSMYIEILHWIKSKQFGQFIWLYGKFHFFYSKFLDIRKKKKNFAKKKKVQHEMKDIVKWNSSEY